MPARNWRETVTVLPGVSGGAPIVRGTGFSVEFLASRFAAGESLAELAEDYDMTLETVENAIRAVVWAAFGRRGLRAETARRLEQEAQHG